MYLATLPAPDWLTQMSQWLEGSFSRTNPAIDDLIKQLQIVAGVIAVAFFVYAMLMAKREQSLDKIKSSILKLVAVAICITSIGAMSKFGNDLSKGLVASLMSKSGQSVEQTDSTITGQLNKLIGGDEQKQNSWVSNIWKALTNPQNTMMEAAMSFTAWLLDAIAIAIRLLLLWLDNMLVQIMGGLLPLFISFLLIPSLAGAGLRFCLFFVSLLLWKIGFALCDIILATFLVNAQGVLFGGAAVTYVALSLIFLALLVVFLYPTAAIAISKWMAAVSNDVGNMLGITLGAANSSAMAIKNAVVMAASTGAGGAAGAAGGAGSLSAGGSTSAASHPAHGASPSIRGTGSRRPPDVTGW